MNNTIYLQYNKFQPNEITEDEVIIKTEGCFLMFKFININCLYKMCHTNFIKYFILS